MACTFAPHPPSGTMEAGVGLWEGAPNTGLGPAEVAVSAVRRHSGLLSLEISCIEERNGLGAWFGLGPLPAIIGTEPKVGEWGQIVVSAWVYLPSANGLYQAALIVTTHPGPAYTSGSETAVASQGTTVNEWFELTTTCSLTAHSAYFNVAVTAESPEPPAGTGVQPPGTRFYVDDVCYAGKTLVDQPPPPDPLPQNCPANAQAVAAIGPARVRTQSPIGIRLPTGPTVRAASRGLAAPGVL